MTKKLLASLNPEQRRAVTTVEGPLLVLAGAGTGKTRVITTRIAHLISTGVAPESILGVTFTNKAAGEMRERLKSLVGKKGGGVVLGTFHAFCVRILRDHAEAAGLQSGFAICDASDQLALFRGALREVSVADEEIQPGMLQQRISFLKNRLFEPDGFLEKASDDKDELVGRAWRRYEEELGKSRLMDFDDLLLRTVRLLRESEATRLALQERFRYILVDEYQDTNGPQYEILRLLTGPDENLCVVGDDDQAIYGFRGADVSKILGFETDFPRATVVKLETNYRSTSQILRAANSVIQNNTERHDKTLRPASPDGPGVTAFALEDEAAEADHVCRSIQDLVRTKEAKLGDFAVLFRAAVQARPLETQLRTRGIPYVLVGGQSFFDRKEVRDVLAYMRVVANPDDELSLLRAINRPPRGVGKTSIDRLARFATSEGIGLGAAMGRCDEVEGLTAGPREAIAGFHRLLETLGGGEPGAALGAWIRQMVEAVGYKVEVERTYPDELQQRDRWRAVDDIASMAERYCERKKAPTLAGFLEALALDATDDGSDDRDDVVTLSTLHAAKGLEFPRVFLVGLEEGLLPHSRSVAEDSIEEERRLCYVGITRARRQLTLTFTLTRAKYGTRIESHPSRFFFEIKGEEPPSSWQAAKAPDAMTPKRKKRAKKARKTRGRRAAR